MSVTRDMAARDMAVGHPLSPLPEVQATGLSRSPGRSRPSQIMFRSDMRRATRRIAALAAMDGRLSRKEYESVIADLVTRRGKGLVAEAEFYCRFLGAFPVLVKLVMLGLMRDGRITAPLAQPDVRDSVERAPWEYDEFDLVEYEWYFDQQSVRIILQQFPSDSRSLVSLGVPTIVPSASAAGYRVTLIDRSPSLLHKHLDLRGDGAAHRAELVEWDLGRAPYVKAESADIVVMDPPWYLEHYQAWLHTAIAACKAGGLLMLALPQALTNRRTFFERSELLTTLNRIGPTQIISNSLSYVTPSFERAVLENDDLDHLARWRRADLALVVKQGNDSLPFGFTSVTAPAWNFRRIGGRIIRTWGEVTDGSRDATPVIAPTSPSHGYRLASVSRSYLASGNINLVTSGGGAAVVERWGRLPQILDSLQDDIDPQKAIQYALPDATAAERHEVANILHEILRR